MRVMLPLVRPFLKSPERGAATSVYLASSAEVEEVSGRYFANRPAKESSSASRDTALAARLWDVSAQLTGVA